MNLADIVRVGTITSVNVKEGTARVEIPDADELITYDLKIIVPKTKDDKDAYTPDIGAAALCLFLGTGDGTDGFVLGSFYNEKDLPPISDANTWKKQFKDGSIISYDTAAHKLLVNVQGVIEAIATGDITAQSGAKISATAAADISAESGANIAAKAAAGITAEAVTIEATATATATVTAPTITLSGNVVISGSLSVAGGKAGVDASGNMAVQGNITTPANITAAQVTGNTDVIAGGISGKNHRHPGVQSGSSTTGAPQ